MASKRHFKRKSCVGKIAHTKAGAHYHAVLLRQKGERVHAYRCRYCWKDGAKAYHVGHFGHNR